MSELRHFVVNVGAPLLTTRAPTTMSTESFRHSRLDLINVVCALSRVFQRDSLYMQTGNLIVSGTMNVLPTRLSIENTLVPGRNMVVNGWHKEHTSKWKVSG